MQANGHSHDSVDGVFYIDPRADLDTEYRPDNDGEELGGSWEQHWIDLGGEG
jgi:hypothetical protein